jgi:hypothetical protein
MGFIAELSVEPEGKMRSIAVCPLAMASSYVFLA